MLIMGDSESSPRVETPFKHDWTKGSVFSNLLLLSWPMVVMESLYVVSQIVDLIWVGRLGSAAIAGVGIANIVLMMVMSMTMGLIVGARAMIARYIGALDIAGANHVAAQAIILSTTWGLLVTVIGLLLAEPVLSRFGLEAEVVTQGVAYMRIMFAGWVAMEVLIMCLYSMQAAGDAITPMKIEFLLRVIHVSICPFLVLGWWIFPRMGVSGSEQRYLPVPGGTHCAVDSPQRTHPFEADIEGFPCYSQHYLEDSKNKYSRPGYEPAEGLRQPYIDVAYYPVWHPGGSRS